VEGHRGQWRGGALGPHRIERIGLDRDQLCAGLGAGRRKALCGCGGIQPWIKSKPIAGHKMLCKPGLGRRIHQRFDAPGIGVDLLARLQRVAAVDEHRGLSGKNDRDPGRTSETGQPGQAFFRWRHVFVLLLIGARNDKSGQVAPRQFLAKRGQPRRQRHASFWFFERLEQGFEHEPRL